MTKKRNGFWKPTKSQSQCPRTNESLPVERQEEEPAFLESNEESSAEETPEADQQQQQARQEQTQVLS